MAYLFFMSEQEIGRTMVSIVPTQHLVRRCKERLGDLSPDMQVRRIVQLKGILVVAMRPDGQSELYLDVDGIGRFVRKRLGSRLLGVTFLPRILCHASLGGS